MAELLLEFLCEEIPARMQPKAATDLKSHLETALTKVGLSFSAVQTFVTPRRLTGVVEGLALNTQSSSEERRGPRLGAPEAALVGFLKSTGVTESACIQRDGYWYATVIQPAKTAQALIPELVRGIIRDFSWGKSMRWPGATLAWVRPVRSILCLLDNHSIPFEVPEFGITTGNKTYGHRSLAPAEIEVSNFTDYRKKLEKAYVILDHLDRQQRIEEGLKTLALETGCEVEVDPSLLVEVAGLTEYPQPLRGTINPEFMRLPKPVLSTSMRVHQKYFTFVDSAGQMAPYFGFAANTLPTDGGEQMVRGYERVLRARLSDAAFFYDQDCAVQLESALPKFDKIIFHAKLGTLGHRVKRFIALATTPETKRAALLSKADLVSSMVGEFPELQGVMGGIYAQIQGESMAVSQAIQQQYQPVGSLDSCPTQPLAIELALIDKIDALVGFFGVGEIPTGSKDPFALRRAALGIIRIIRENKLKNYDLKQKLVQAEHLYQEQGISFIKKFHVDQVIDFILERLAQALRMEGIRHDCLAAVLNAHHDKNICSLADRAANLTEFMKSDAGASLQAAFRRAQGILVKSDLNLSAHSLILAQLGEPAEKNLFIHLDQLSRQTSALLEGGKYLDLMQLLSELRPFVDEFFTLKINADAPADRLNRLALLQQLIDQIRQVADFSKLEG